MAERGGQLLYTPQVATLAVVARVDIYGGNQQFNGKGKIGDEGEEIDTRSIREQRREHQHPLQLTAAAVAGGEGEGQIYELSCLPPESVVSPRSAPCSIHFPPLCPPSHGSKGSKDQLRREPCNMGFDLFVFDGSLSHGLLLLTLPCGGFGRGLLRCSTCVGRGHPPVPPPPPSYHAMHSHVGRLWPSRWWVRRTKNSGQGMASSQRSVSATPSADCLDIKIFGNRLSYMGTKNPASSNRQSPRSRTQTW